jgi:hypothetical protein
MSQWVKVSRDIYSNNRSYHCAVCGQRIATRVWEVEFQEKKLNFCNSECEQLWFDYWLPKHGKEHGWSTI